MEVRHHRARSQFNLSDGDGFEPRRRGTRVPCVGGQRQRHRELQRLGLDDGPQPAAGTVSQLSSASAAPASAVVWAAVRYAAQPWGTELEVRVTGIPVGTRCQLLVTNAQDQHIAAGGWTITADSQHTWYPAYVPWPTASLRSFDVAADGQTLVTVPARQAGAPSRAQHRAFCAVGQAMPHMCHVSRTSTVGGGNSRAHHPAPSAHTSVVLTLVQDYRSSSLGRRALSSSRSGKCTE